MINIEIDGQKLQAQPGAMIIQVADEAGVYIPRFCYHKKLSIAANCRMCLVQVGEGKKPVPACATPIAEGMKVFTKSELALTAQKAVMEFLLINHPLDCPICDQGGQCELQDLSMGFGTDHSRYTEPKRVVKDKDIGPLVQTDMTRCIQCTRCVRFGQEIAGFPELGVLGRSEREEIGTYVAKAMTSELSGNVVDVCPVGALTAKPSRYTFRAWEVQQRATVSPHDCIGSNLYAHVLNNKVMRMVPRENEAINEVWLSDRDRFSYQGLYSPERLTSPMIKREGKWETVEWLTALEFATEKLQKVLNSKGAEQLAGFIGPSSTVEEQYLFQKLLRGVGCHNIDHRLQQIDLRDQSSWPLMPNFGMRIADIPNLNSILLIGADIANDQPILNVRLRKAMKNGAKVMNVSSSVQTLANILKAVGSDHPLVQAAQPTPEERAIAENLLAGKSTAIFLGIAALRDPHASEIHLLARLLAEKTQASLGYLPIGANTPGAWLTGCVPHRLPGGKESPAGLDWKDALQQKLAAYILFGFEPEYDCAYRDMALQTLQNAECVIVMDSFKTTTMLSYADVILPIAPFTETSGTFINIQGDWQAFTAVTNPLKETRPGWKVLRVLGNFLKVPNFEYAALDEVTAEVKNILAESNAHPQVQWNRHELPSIVKNVELVPVRTFRVDGIVRRAGALQASPRNKIGEKHVS